MATIQCKMCGGQVELPDGVTTGECPYCGSVTTFPRIDSEQKEHLYTRAEHFRQANNFDKAVASYEALLNLDGEDPEAYWGLLISRYGIEYVEDPATHERVPTCHRVQFDSILADSDYQNALKYASGSDRDIYEKEANRIAEIQKSILRISAQEKPYDIFICYKETTAGGTRTKDSTLAQDIYYQLTNQGLKVFFSRITLEDKLGQQYEPYIFAALNSAKVMLVIGSKREYFESVWMRNEWSRFLALKKKDRSRLLIPCYKDMDPYDIPEELSLFQSQDMSKIGFMQDLLRGVMKVVNAGKTASFNASATPASTSTSSANSDVGKMMKRISILMSQGEWEEAKSNCKDTLKIDPENAELYLLLCMINHKIPEENGLWKANFNLQEDKNYQVAFKFASPERKKQLEEIQIQTLVNSFLHECMKANGISNEGDLSCADMPLAEDVFFQKALKVAPPERKKILLQIQYDQVEYFLKQLKNSYHVEDLIQLRSPLNTEQLFQKALFCASPEHRKELEDLPWKQCDFFLGKCMESKHVFNEVDLSQSEMPLAINNDFQTALLCASPKRRKELQRLQDKQVEFFLQKCVEENHVSSEAELPCCSSPLNTNYFFMLAVQYASPERRERLEQIQAAQSDAFLQKCIKANHVTHVSELVNCRTPLREDLYFTRAQQCAFPKQRERLDILEKTQLMQIKAREKRRKFFIAVCATILAILLIVIWSNRLSIVATLGGAETKYKVGVRYENGEGVKRDMVKALRWYQKAAERGHAEAKRVLDNYKLIELPGGVSLVMVKVEAGTFEMSVNIGMKYYSQRTVAHIATLKHAFYIAQTEVTQAQWKSVMGKNPSVSKGNKMPVESVSWNDAMFFCSKLNKMGKAPSGWTFSLPTETQWEYAAQGGNRSNGYIYSGSNIIHDVAWFEGNTDTFRKKEPHPVMQKKANELGIYDMSGNVSEWCLDDWSNDSRNLKEEFARGNDQYGSNRSVRGGSWYNTSSDCKTVSRSFESLDYRDDRVGFRPALVPSSYSNQEISF